MHMYNQSGVNRDVCDVFSISFIKIHPSDTSHDSQAEAKKPGLQHHTSLDTRNPDFVAC